MNESFTSTPTQSVSPPIECFLPCSRLSAKSCYITRPTQMQSCKGKVYCNMDCSGRRTTYKKGKSGRRIKDQSGELMQQDLCGALSRELRKRRRGRKDNGSFTLNSRMQTNRPTGRIDDGSYRDLGNIPQPHKRMNDEPLPFVLQYQVVESTSNY